MRWIDVPTVKAADGFTLAVMILVLADSDRLGACYPLLIRARLIVRFGRFL